MKSCFGKKRTAEDVERTEQDRKIASALKEEDRQEEAIKILILGTGDSGKTTFTKQLTCMHGGVSDEVLESYAFILKDLALRAAQVLLCGAEEAGLVVGDLVGPTKSIMEAQLLTPDIAKLITSVTARSDLQQLLDERGESLQMQGGVSGAQFYWKHAERFAADGFKPTHDDYIKARIKTTGVVESHFMVAKTSFTIVDVGGQRSERKKWLNCFGAVDAIIFLAAINEYDMVLEEDENENRMVESIKLWRALSNAPFFKGVPFILFLNKSDLFEEKLPRVPLSEVFSDYPVFYTSEAVNGMTDFEKGWRFIKDQYLKFFSGNSLCYVHLTCAVDTEACRNVWNSVKDYLFRRAMEDAAL